MTQASRDLSVAALFAEREARRRNEQEAAERLQRRKEEELAAYKQRLENFHCVPCQGAQMSWVRIPPGNSRSSRKRPERIRRRRMV